MNGCSGDVACIDKCIVDGKAGAATYSAQNACVNLYCTSQCSGAVDACRECRLKNCALEHVTCFADPDCRRYGYCFEACTTSECDAACRARFSAGTVATYDGYLACLKNKCEAECL